ncbi:MAG TPA: alpha/beta hydrolase [Streptosporangiaceae bacterium]|nr:alpha/beta hydrolase [Streptosporangiaceae bacterium]
MAIDEATAGFLSQLAESGAKPLHEMTPEEARGFTAALRDLFGPGPDVLKAYDEQVATPDGGHITVRVLVPDGDIRALVVYYHGGGWVIGNIEESDHLTRKLANALHAAVVNVDYRLAPEHRYPVAADDAWTALQWASGQMAGIAGGPVPLVVMGDSAGGNLSAVVAQKARDSGGPEIASQVLVYPVTDTDLDNDTYIDPANQLLLTRDSMVWFWDHYAPDPASRLNPDASPNRASDLSGLAPAIVLTAEHDPLRAEGEAYAGRLRDAGVPVELRRFPGQMHGFFTMVGVLPGSADAIAYVTEELARQLGSEQDGEQGGA